MRREGHMPRHGGSTDRVCSGKPQMLLPVGKPEMSLVAAQYRGSATAGVQS